MEAVKTEEIAMQNETGNHMMPFLWLKGEGEATIREYMRVIHDSGINAVCVESRPHPDFSGTAGGRIWMSSWKRRKTCA